jgi:UDP-3-O-[3-hydroxymyristoyl] glucosamine N-acyltransferase
MKFSAVVAQLSEAQGKELTANCGTNPEILGVEAIDQARDSQISFVDHMGQFDHWIEKTSAGALILPEQPELQARATARGLPWVSTREPRLAFAQSIALFYKPYQPGPGIHPTAVIDPSASIGPGVSLGAHVVIEAGVVLEAGVCIHPNVVVYPGCRIGADTVIHANATIEERSQLGARCVIHSGAVIGSEGFGFVPTAKGWVKMEQSGYVIIEDGVEIGSNSAVDRPAVGTTRIGTNTKLDNMVHIGHGVQIGAGCAMAAQVGIAGGAEIGRGVILAGQSGVANRVKVGDRVMASSKTGIHADVEAGQVVSGFPAIPNRLWLRTVAIYKRLPEMYKTVKLLQKAEQHGAAELRGKD